MRKPILLLPAPLLLVSKWCQNLASGFILTFATHPTWRFLKANSGRLYSVDLHKDTHDYHVYFNNHRQAHGDHRDFYCYAYFNLQRGRSSYASEPGGQSASRSHGSGTLNSPNY